MTITIIWSWASFIAGFFAPILLGLLVLVVLAIKQASKKTKVVAPSRNKAGIDRWLSGQ
jgi:hypothetical protein|tara:strand:- start:1730 stop:1906 length:177 start_codon:yes stop_codon:yes gene_type:complete